MKKRGLSFPAIIIIILFFIILAVTSFFLAPIIKEKFDGRDSPSSLINDSQAQAGTTNSGGGGTNTTDSNQDTPNQEDSNQDAQDLIDLQEQIPNCTESDWTSSISPISCPLTSNQTKSWSKIGNCENGMEHDSSETISCNPNIPTCTDFTYSDWRDCTQSGTQSRSVLTSSPNECQGGNPVLSQQCTYIPLSCSDGTLIDSCSLTKPLYCNSTGKLNFDCSRCRCNSGYVCENGGCVVEEISYWKFDTNANDEAGINNGILMNGARIENNFLVLDGVNDYVKINHISSLDSATKISISAWIKLSPSIDYQVISSDTLGSSDIWNKWYFGIRSNSKKLFFSIMDTSSIQYSSGDYELPDYNKWYHVVGVVDKNMGLSLYVDGELVLENSKSFSLKQSSGIIYIGSKGEDNDADYFKGSIDDLMIYNNALTEQEILDVYSIQKTDKSPKFIFAAITDPHIGLYLDYPDWLLLGSKADEVLKTAVEDINKQGVNFTIITGDISTSGTLAQLTKASSLLNNLAAPFYVVSGNHDNAGSDGKTAFMNIFGFSSINYTFNFGEFHFIVVDPTLDHSVNSYMNFTKELRDWIEDDLFNNPNKYTFFITHPNLQAQNTPLNGGTYFGLVSGSTELKNILENNGNVIATIGGHTHTTKYTNTTISYITLGSLLVYPLPITYFYVYDNRIEIVQKSISNQTLLNLASNLCSQSDREILQGDLNNRVIDYIED
ncbi:MAG: metallophosphoesterase [Nanoarchaeota archaeon]|nr:metallophosphoesterase [Nanoarchaeota archaeon]